MGSHYRNNNSLCALYAPDKYNLCKVDTLGLSELDGAAFSEWGLPEGN